jgi:hypothetical protein
VQTDSYKEEKGGYGGCQEILMLTDICGGKFQSEETTQAAAHDKMDVIFTLTR